MAAEVKRQRVVLETERYRITGDVTLPAEGFHGRLSDMLNREGINFIAVSNAVVRSLNGEEPELHGFIAVARDHVQIAFEANSS
jgi:hypothetical protein